MANQEHLSKIREGVQAWNYWRSTSETSIPSSLSDADLSSADLSHTDLSSADLSYANLSGADLSSANLSGVDLSHTDLSSAKTIKTHFEDADLRGSNLSNIDLWGAELWRVSFINTILKDANLSNTDLINTNFNDADLTNTNFSEAILQWTTFGNVDLSVVKGLDMVKHNGPSTIGIDTIHRSRGNIPEVFLKGAGVDDTFITYIRSLVGSAIEYYSCFISYSSKDEAFAKRLHADLQSHNVRCWFAPHDMKIGDRIRDRIDDFIRIYEKLLIILSEDSLASDWVEDEVDAALEKERTTREQGKKHTVLFPIRLDDAVKTTTEAWAAKFRRQRHIGDFCDWKDHDAYQKAFERLLRDLKADS